MKCPILQNQNDSLLPTVNKPFSNGLYCEMRKEAWMDSNLSLSYKIRLGGAKQQLMRRGSTISLYSMPVSLD